VAGSGGGKDGNLTLNRARDHYARADELEPTRGAEIERLRFCLRLRRHLLLPQPEAEKNQYEGGRCAIVKQHQANEELALVGFHADDYRPYSGRVVAGA
jgi:hypothetical protein